MDLDPADEKRHHDLLREIDFGLQIQQFLDNEIGQRLLRDSQEEERALMEEGVRLNPDDPETLPRRREIYHRIGVLDHWQSLFASYINAGKAAEKLYHEAENIGDEGR
jgi:hypothetical protein